MRDGDLKMLGLRSNNNEGMAFTVQWKGGNDRKKWETVSGEEGDNFLRITIEGRPGTFEAKIDRFYIYKQFRRHGLGSRVMRMLQNKYREYGTKQMKVTNATSEGAIFYKKNGFDVCPVTRDLVCDLNKAYAKAVELHRLQDQAEQLFSPRTTPKASPASPASPLPPPPMPPPHPGPASPPSPSLSRAIQKAQEEAAQIFNFAKPTPAVTVGSTFAKPAQNTKNAKVGPLMGHETKCKCCSDSAANSGACKEFDEDLCENYLISDSEDDNESDSEDESQQPRDGHARRTPSMDSDEARSAQPRAWRAPGSSRNEAGSLQKLQEEAAQIFGTKPAAAAAVVVDDKNVDSEHETEHESDDETEHESDDDSDYDPEAFVVPAPPSHKRGPKPSKRMLEPGRPARSVDEMDAINWKIEVCPNAEGFLQLTEARTGHKYVVPKPRVRKAMQMLNPDDVSSCTSEVENKCNCSRKCHEVLKNKDIAAHRLDLLNAPNEEELTNRLADIVRRNNREFRLGGKRVCRAYYSQVCDVSETKLKKVLQLAKLDSGATCITKGPRTVKPTQDMQTVHAKTFWRWFFDNYSQKPNDRVRLFPVNQTYTEIWENFFQEWWNKSKLPIDEKPAQRTWINARQHEEFNDVQRRPKHFHCRCTTCNTLQERDLVSWKNADERGKHQRDKRLHYASVKAWRDLEQSLCAQARQDPGGTILLYYDDTEAFGFPHMTNRPFKNMPKSRFYVVPWLLMNKGVGTQEYIYMPKKKWSKGANRIITQLHAYISSIKSDPTNIQHKARRLILIGDNYSENKNNTLLAWMSDLVANKWFDDVECLFGEVGHTHSGDDATHNIHNNPCGNHANADLGQFIFNYRKTFSESTCPRAHILDVVYDWTKYYKPFTNPPLSGFSKTPHDMYTSRGFRATRAVDNTVHLQWKVDPAMDKDWRGKDGNAGLGFYLLKKATTGFPELVIPKQELMKKSGLKELLSHGSFLQPYGVHKAARFNRDCAEHGVVPIAREVETSTPTGQWGPLVLIGSNENALGSVRFIRRIWWPGEQNEATSIWSLPPLTLERATSLQYHYSGDQALLDNRPLPYIRQGKVAPQQSGTWNHPGNIERRKNAPTLLSMVGGAGGENSDEEPMQPGNWDKDGSKDVFVIDFKLCKKNSYAVMLCQDKDTQKTFIEVAKIMTVDKDNKTFDGKKLQCTKDATTAECLEKNAAWNEHGKKNTETCEGSCVIVYLKKLNKGCKLPQAAINAIKERGVFEEVGEDEPDDDNDNDDDDDDDDDDDEN